MIMVLLICTVRLSLSLIKASRLVTIEVENQCQTPHTHPMLAGGSAVSTFSGV